MLRFCFCRAGRHCILHENIRYNRKGRTVECVETVKTFLTKTTWGRGATLSMSDTILETIPIPPCISLSHQDVRTAKLSGSSCLPRTDGWAGVGMEKGGMRIEWRRGAVSRWTGPSEGFYYVRLRSHVRFLGEAFVWLPHRPES
jgi:hypothetical protein